MKRSTPVMLELNSARGFEKPAHRQKRLKPEKRRVPSGRSFHALVLSLRRRTSRRHASRRAFIHRLLTQNKGSMNL